jgi:hypothetical protein
MGFFFGRRRTKADLALVEAAQGSTACMAFIAYMNALIDATAIAQLNEEWPRAEVALLRCVADCPPDMRPILADVLARAHEMTTHRVTQRGLMDARRMVVAHE